MNEQFLITGIIVDADQHRPKRAPVYTVRGAAVGCADEDVAIVNRDGHFSAIVPRGRSYAFTAIAQGYKEEHVKIAAPRAGDRVNIVIELHRLRPDQADGKTRASTGRPGRAAAR